MGETRSEYSYTMAERVLKWLKDSTFLYTNLHGILFAEYREIHKTLFKRAVHV